MSDGFGGNDEILTAIGKALRSAFGGDCAVYDEEVKQGAEAPCFFISCAESKERQYLGARYFCERKYSVKYCPKDNNRKKGECEEVSRRLFDCLLRIGEEGRLFMGRKMNSKYEKGILSFCVNYDTFLYRQEKKTLMGELSQRTVPKG